MGGWEAGDGRGRGEGGGGVVWQSHPIMCAGNDFISEAPVRSPVSGNCVCAGDGRPERSGGGQE